VTKAVGATIEMS